MVAIAEHIKVPELRFPEFSGEWEEKRLGEIGKTRNGLTYSPSDVTTETEGILVARSSNIQEGMPHFEDCVFVSMEVPEQSVLRENDILICVRNGSRRLIGKKLLVNHSLTGKAFGAFMSVFESSQNMFVNQLMDSNRFKKQIHQNLGATINQITTKNLAEFKFQFPSLTEQQKIAEFLTAVDEKIGKLKRKKELLEAYKKGAMQKLFSQEIRFKDDQGNPYPDWEERALGSIVESVKRKAATFDYPVLTISSKIGFALQSDRFSQVIAGDSLPKYTLLRKNELSYNRGNSKTYPFGCVFKLSRQAALVPNVYKSFRSTESNPDYLEHYFAKGGLNKQLNRIITSGARSNGLLNISDTDFYSCRLNVPSLPEQQKIAEFLTGIDDKITAVANQIDKAAEFKKGLLQKMFV